MDVNSKKKCKIILEKWLTSFTAESRKHSKLPELFEELVCELFSCGIEFYDAYDVVKDACKELYPSPAITKAVYDKSSNKKKTYAEFIKNWQQSIDKVGVDAFYIYYTMEKPLEKTKKTTELKDEDALNNEYFWKTVRKVSKDNPWVFSKGDNKDEE